MDTAKLTSKQIADQLNITLCTAMAETSIATLYGKGHGRYRTIKSAVKLIELGLIKPFSIFGGNLDIALIAKTEMVMVEPTPLGEDVQYWAKKRIENKNQGNDHE